MTPDRERRIIRARAVEILRAAEPDASCGSGRLARVVNRNMNSLIWVVRELGRAAGDEDGRD